ncbi:ubiquinol-cytochrome c reductase subunit 8 [Cladophialophora psammophila CBS 110553]|uniref:Cytochrome b-c1 complex subunit 8 n=1 Tax=Cladophialophora psammophila CBS 110553 TaxID=1182543 RepID=W9X9Z4_9EURO|nr:ubiquinol-cytochrome c reductase subunit 8 [Cladophialophora psammophila CBS 110553]EXJ73756.1 ubiquinol-cytochrome c reductase subunit 8 [Cladophialophora psammophila CBS 110553]
MEYKQDIPKGRKLKPVYCWGHKELPAQRGVVTYLVSPNRQNPLARALHNAVFNTFRRTKNQVLYWVPPFVVAYLLMDWANRR